MEANEIKAISWEEVSRAFAPFPGTCLYAIRADTFFHLVLRDQAPARFVLKNLAYPLLLGARSRQRKPVSRRPPSGSYLFVCDYPAEAGYGSLRPLLQSCPAPASVVVNSAVLKSRRHELGQFPGLCMLLADVLQTRPESSWVSRAQNDYAALVAASGPRLRRLLKASRLVVSALLFRAYGYREFNETLLKQSRPKAVITHNDFTSLSYLAGDTARKFGIPDFTLQHGFPSPEYFPTTASHYLVWGQATSTYMERHNLHGSSSYATIGAPRLDSLADLHHKRPEAVRHLERLGLRHPDKLNVLFLSQSHSPAFSSLEHRWIQSLVRDVGKQPGVHLLIRPHPQESGSRFRRRQPLADCPVIPAGISLIESVLGSDVVLSVNSTAMLEAALLRTPVVQICAARFEDRLGMLRFPRSVTNPDSAIAIFHALSDGREREACVAEQQALIETQFAHPGFATAKAWSYIEKVVADRSKLAATVAAGD